MRALKLLTGRTVIVGTPATTVRGVIESSDNEVVTLVEAVALETGQEIVVDGLLLLPISRVDYVQVV